MRGTRVYSKYIVEKLENKHAVPIGTGTVPAFQDPREPGVSYIFHFNNSEEGYHRGLRTQIKCFFCLF